MSNALALFHLSQILSKVVDALYPAGSTRDVTPRKIGLLHEELEKWHKDIPAHLRLQFNHEKPSTETTGNRSPFLVCHMIVREQNSDVSSRLGTITDGP